MSSKRPFSGSVAFFSPAWPPEADSNDADVFVVEPEYTPPLRARRLVNRLSGLGGALRMGPALARSLCALLARLEREADLQVLEMEESFGLAGAVSTSSPVPVVTCEPENPEALAAAIVRLLEDPELAARPGRRARLDCMTRYPPSTIASQTLAVYQRHIS